MDILLTNIKNSISTHHNISWLTSSNAGHFW